MPENVVGWLPAVAAATASFLAVYIRLRQPAEKYTTAWLILFASLAVTAIVATLVGNSRQSDERERSQQAQQDLGKQLSEVRGQMSALLLLVPSLAKGNPQEVVDAVQQTTELQARLSELEAKALGRRLSPEQRAKLAEVVKPCASTMNAWLKIPANDSEAETFSEDFRTVFQDAGYGSLYTTRAWFTRPTNGVFVKVWRPAEPPACAISFLETLRGFGIEAAGRRGDALGANDMELLIGGKPE